MTQHCRRVLSLPLPALAFAACAERAPTARNVIVISVDTLRADRLGCYGHELVDVVPTVLDTLGLAAPNGLDGESLQPLFDGRTVLGERPMFFETSHSLRTPTLEGVRRGSHKMVLDVSTGVRELYDLAADPDETRDLSAERPEIVGRLEEDLRWIQDQRHQADTRELSDEAKEQLRALGYL